MERVPDDPVWIEARAVLLESDRRLFGSPEGFAVRSDRLRLGALVGDCPASAIRAAFSGIDPAVDDPARIWAVVAPEGFTAEAGEALEGWCADDASIFREPDNGGVSSRPATARVRPIRDSDSAWLDHLPGELASELVDARERSEIVAAWVDGRPVSFCYCACESESLWDVSINTAPEYRRRGLAADCVAWLAARMSMRGKRAVWGAHSGNAASRALARKLGFESWGRLFFYENWAGGTDYA